MKELKQENLKLKEKVKSKENQFEIIIYFLNKIRNLYEKTKIVQNPNEDDYLTLKNITSDNLQTRLIELENFITNLKSESTKQEFDSSKHMIENLKPFNDKIDDLSNENKLLRTQIQQILINEENRIKERESALINTVNQNQNKFQDTIHYKFPTAEENVFTNNYQNPNQNSNNNMKRINVNGIEDKQERIEKIEKATSMSSNNVVSIIPESIQKKINSDIENEKKYEKPKSVKYTAVPKFGKFILKFNLIFYLVFFT